MDLLEQSAQLPPPRGRGRPRADGLVPGSPEAIAADRAKDAARKRRARALERARRAAVLSTCPSAPCPAGAAPPPTPAGRGGLWLFVALAALAFAPWLLPLFVKRRST